MCGITGFFSFNYEQNQQNDLQMQKAAQALNLRGPDFQKCINVDKNIGLAHARLSIIDTSDSANQPMQAYNGRFTIVFNGEIYNYRELKKLLENDKGEIFNTQSDTEVILRMFYHYKEKCLNYFNGFFAFAIYDNQTKELFIARDRMGIKPLIYTFQNESFYFASEMKAIMKYNIERKIDFTSLQQYFQFNYIPQPFSIFKDVYKLKPGHFLKIAKDKTYKEECYYKIPETKNYSNISYENAQSELKKLLNQSVERRMVADVPLGSYLSGGIDSSIIATIAAKKKPDLNTFSIGFKDNPYFDETEYANLVAKKIKSNHTVFSLTNNDLYENLHNILDYIDEPFADSSAIPVYILSKNTRKHVTVSLSGDGADEMFGGYNKHYAEYRMLQNSLLNSIVKIGAPIWNVLPKSRHSKYGNIVRQLDRFAQGAKLDAAERYWRWCSFTDEKYPKQLIKSSLLENESIYGDRKGTILNKFSNSTDINETLLTDMNLVLVNDMLTKVDLMSMANSLEVRVPFLDHELVNFAFQLPGEYKVNKNGRKTILKDAYRNELPKELYSRNKMGFEVPLLQWFQTDLKSLILDDLLEDEFILEQNIFNLDTINELKKRLFSKNPGEVHAQLWALIVFQTWYKKYMM